MATIPYAKELSFRDSECKLEKFDLTKVAKIEVLQEWCAWDLPGGKRVPQSARVNKWVYKANVSFRDGSTWSGVFIYGSAWLWRDANGKQADLVEAKSITLNIR